MTEDTRKKHLEYIAQDLKLRHEKVTGKIEFMGRFYRMKVKRNDCTRRIVIYAAGERPFNCYRQIPETTKSNL